MASPLESLALSEIYNVRYDPSVSQQRHTVNGIVITVFGLDQLPLSTVDIAAAWLLHPRLGAQDDMAGIANALVRKWNNTHSHANGPRKGLIAITLDHRNHGTRLLDPAKNDNWRQGNSRHAEDMFETYHGTAQDVSMLISRLPAVLFGASTRHITENAVLGVSLGGHAAWTSIVNEPRIETAIIIVGCPDYVNLMADRARLSKIPSWKKSDPPGSSFLGSESFPSSLMEMVRRFDPASLFLGTGDGAGNVPLRMVPAKGLTDEETESLRPLFTKCLARKKIFNMSGGRDKGVPYRCGEVFVNWLKQVVAPGGVFGDMSIEFEDVVYENAGHEVTPDMADKAIQFMIKALAGAKDSGIVFSRGTKSRI
ncbi:hypothetical protein FE257_002082 [Aspergillus nanangensis]|uniref:AB hydrolase-1 domain-containing protein n=1 Tax=Aspergillus nanangensis TaxID=2582783 RepID=A0AAD4CTB0_ASPNN|nr:hypothetical protein FE257_002082 [Aspergillus nanangensis]